MNSHRGAFIVFEGADRSGKTTQAKKIVDYFNKIDVPAELFGFPNRSTAIGSVINKYLTGEQILDDHVIHLLFAANRWEAVSDIKTKLAAGITIVCDRYSYSGVAYSNAKGLDINWCYHPEIGLPQPDLVLFFDLSDEALAKRPGFGDEIYERPAFQKKVNSVFDKLYDKSYWTKIDADADIEEIYHQVKCIVTEKVIEVRDNPLQTLNIDFIN